MPKMLIPPCAGFAVALLAGYLTFRGEIDESTHAAVQSNHGDQVDRVESSDLKRKQSASREVKPFIHRDAAGNFLLPPALISRFRFMPMTGTKLNRLDLRVLGFSEEQLDRMQEMVDDARKRRNDRARQAMREFSSSAQEKVWLIPGNREAEIADRQRVTEELREIAGNRAPLVEERMTRDIDEMTQPFSGKDSYLRLSRTADQEGLLSFEWLTLHPKEPHQPMPQPGDSFVDYQDRYRFNSVMPYPMNSNPPDHLAPLLEGKSWPDLLSHP